MISKFEMNNVTVYENDTNCLPAGLRKLFQKWNKRGDSEL